MPNDALFGLSLELAPVRRVPAPSPCKLSVFPCDVPAAEKSSAPCDGAGETVVSIQSWFQSCVEPVARGATWSTDVHDEAWIAQYSLALASTVMW